MPYLEFEGQSRPLGPGVLTIGSGTEAIWRLLGRELLPIHAVFTMERDGGALLTKGAPHAAIWINDVELEDRLAYLRYGDRIRLGYAEFRYRQFASAEHPDAYLHDTRRGRLYKLDAPLTPIGRDIACPVLVQDPEVSRVHAEISRQGEGDFVIRTIGSAYTLLNSNRLADARKLKEGDEVTVGRTVFRFTFEPPKHLKGDVGRQTNPGGNKRAAKMQTMFVGPIAAREKVMSDERRKYGMIGAGVAAVVVVLMALVQLLFK